jgi:hypothetical protein
MSDTSDAVAYFRDREKFLFKRSLNELFSEQEAVWERHSRTLDRFNRLTDVTAVTSENTVNMVAVDVSGKGIYSSDVGVFFLSR